MACFLGCFARGSRWRIFRGGYRLPDPQLSRLARELRNMLVLIYLPYLATRAVCGRISARNGTEKIKPFCRVIPTRNEVMHDEDT